MQFFKLKYQNTMSHICKFFTSKYPSYIVSIFSPTIKDIQQYGKNQADHNHGGDGNKYAAAFALDINVSW
jgi:hypothetical protein